jgi:hypothetical protein
LMQVRPYFLVGFGHIPLFTSRKFDYIRPECHQGCEEILGTVPAHCTHGWNRLARSSRDSEVCQERCTLPEPLLDPEDRPRRPCDPAHEEGDDIVQDVAYAG